jgi:arsenate reductase (thioredoxin)
MNILILCTGNSCRSILAEAVFNHLAPPGWRAMSAGSKPTGFVHPRSLALLQREGISTEGLHSKSWENLPETPDVVITVCASAAGETCPADLARPSHHPSTAATDPLAVTGRLAQRRSGDPAATGRGPMDTAFGPGSGLLHPALNRVVSATPAPSSGPRAPSQRRLDALATNGGETGEPGPAVRAHWGVDDPAKASGTDAEIEAAFEQAYRILRRRIEALLALPLDELERDPQRLKSELDRIGGPGA